MRLGQPGQEPGEQQGRLADPGWAADREQGRFLESGQELVDQPLAAEEERRVGRLERGEPLERADERGGRLGRVGACLGRDAERRVLNEDGALELLHLERGLEPELVVEELPRAPVDVKALGLAAAAVEGEHQLRPEALTVRVVGDQRLELGDEAEVSGERELGVDPLLDRCETELLQPLGFDPRKSLELEIGERPPTPELLGCAERDRCGGWIAAGKRLAAFRGQPLEPLQVELPRLDPEQVAGRPRDQTGLVRRQRAQELAKPRDVVVEGVLGRVQALVGEELADQPLTRDDAIRAEQEEREQPALLRSTGVDHLSVQANRERTKDAELETRRFHAGTAVSMHLRALTSRRELFGSGLRAA